MALQQVIDDALSTFLVRAQPILSPLLPSLKRYSLCVGLVIGLPFYLFLLLVSSSVFHWWHFPWSLQVTRWLFGMMTFSAVVDALIYSAASLLFFLTWWRKKVCTSEQKRLHMALSYMFTPFIYGLIAAWGVTILRGHTRNQLAPAALIVFALLSSGRILLTLIQGRDSLPIST